jgi:outer membrane protein
MIKLFPFIAIVILIEVMVARPVGAQIQMSLMECLEYGFVHNPTLKAADYRVAASEEARKSVRADFFPSLSTTYSLNRLNSQSAKGPTETDYIDQDARDFSLRLSQVLYAGSRIVNSYNIAVIEKEKIMFDRALAELELAYNIEIIYFQLMGAEQDVKVALESVKNLEEGVKSAKAYFKENLISYAEVLTTVVDLDNAQQKLSIAKNDVNRKRVALFSLMNMPVSETIGFYGELDFYSKEYESNFDSCWEIASKNRPDLDSLSLQVAIDEKEAVTALGS